MVFYKYPKKYIKIIYHNIFHIISIIYCSYCRLKKTQKNSIVFLTDYANGSYYDNLKYICDGLIEDNKKLPKEKQIKIYWVKRKKRKTDIFPKEIILKYGVFNIIKYISICKIIITNQKLTKFKKWKYKKKPDQKMLLFWHGALGIKKINAKDYFLGKFKDKEIAEQEYQKSEKYDKVYFSSVDYTFSNSKFEDNVLVSLSPYLKNKIITTGHPRLDQFFYNEDKKNQIKQQIREKLNIPDNKKILLYCPTYRNNKQKHLDCDLETTIDSLNKKFGGDFLCICKLHPREKNAENLQSNKNIIILNNFIVDTHQLLLLADVLISDYSSVIFDFIFQPKPVFIYAPDLEQYKNGRGFYYPIESTPFSIATTNQQLQENIFNFSQTKEELQKIYNEFIKSKGCMENGHSTENVIKFINEIMDK